MIKLFWNTHNQKKPNSENKKIREKEESDYGWGQYHEKSSNKWIYKILEKVKYNIIDSVINLEKDDILIIIDSSVEEKNELYTKNIPDPEILIRTGGGKRLSNFLLWQLAYTEIFFIDKMWPDFNKIDFNKIVKKFYNIKRNFGKI